VDGSGSVDEEELRVLLIALQGTHPQVTPFLQQKVGGRAGGQGGVSVTDAR